MYQKVTIVGRLGKDPEMRYTGTGTPVTSFSVATERKYTDATGVMQSSTVWWRVTVWRKLAELCNQYLAKGRLVLAEGEVAEPKPYQGRDGTWRSSLELTANVVKFLSAKNDGEGTGIREDLERIFPDSSAEEDIAF